MREWIRNVSRLLLAGLLAATLAGPPAEAARPTIYENGFKVTHYEGCGHLGLHKRDRQDVNYIPPRVDDMACSPGGSWGDYVYLLVTEQDAAAGIFVDLERVAFNGRSEFYRGVEAAADGTHLSFAPPGWGGGEVLFTTVDSSPFLSLIHWIPFAGPTLRTIFADSLGPVAVDPGGDFGGDVFHESDGNIVRVDALGNESLFAFPPFVGPEMRFGPGDAWGTNLYVGGSVIAPDGTITAFPTVFGEFDWAQGPGFDGDMFELVPGNPGTVDRILPDGSRIPFGTVTASDVAFCDDSLWFVGDEGCYVVTPVALGRHRK